MLSKYDYDHLPNISNAEVVILQSKWYREYTDILVKKCKEVLVRAQCPEPDFHVLPGSLEIPLAAQKLIRSAKQRPETIICFGAIIKGETHHFEMIMNETIRSLGTVMLNEDVPIIVEILPVNNLEQLKARSSDNESNKGIEAGIAAAEIIHWRREIINACN